MMHIYQYLQQLTQSRWSGLNIYFDDVPRPPGATGCTRLCEALGNSFRETTALDVKNLACSGGLRALGCPVNDGHRIAHLARETPMTYANAERIVYNTPHLPRPASYVHIGPFDKPNLLASFLPPNRAMVLLRAWQRLSGESLSIQLSAFTAACAAIAEAAINRRLIFSLGCPDSRKFAAIESHLLIAVLPMELAVAIQNDAPFHPGASGDMPEKNSLAEQVMSR